jgi:uncharacterized protein
MLIDQIKSDMVAALKSAETLRVQTLRMLMSEVNYEQIRLQRPTTDADVQTVLTREVKKRREAIESYEAAGRTEQAINERVEMEILQEYMPKLMSEDEIRTELTGIKEIEGVKEFGQVMRIVSPIFRGKAEGAIVARGVKKWLE